jgi:hypothetical protein
VYAVLAINIPIKNSIVNLSNRSLEESALVKLIVIVDSVLANVAEKLACTHYDDPATAPRVLTRGTVYMINLHSCI